jgi:hypothetical protein
MSIEYKPYDPEEIESLKMTLEAEAREGNPLFYEVKVDGNTRIRRTDKVERFDSMHNYINENTQTLVIVFYPDGSNNRKEWYKYKLSKKTESLNGNEMEQKVNEQVSAQMKQYAERMEARRVEEKLKETEEKLEHAEGYIDILQDQLEEVKTKTNYIGNWDLGKLAGSTIKEIAIHYPKILENVPVLNGITRVIQEEEKQKPRLTNPSFEGEVSFKPKEQSTPATAQDSEEIESIRALSDFIGEHFTEKEKIILGWVIEALGENPKQLPTVAGLLNIDVAARLKEE